MVDGAPNGEVDTHFVSSVSGETQFKFLEARVDTPAGAVCNDNLNGDNDTSDGKGEECATRDNPAVNTVEAYWDFDGDPADDVDNGDPAWQSADNAVEAHWDFNGDPVANANLEGEVADDAPREDPVDTPAGAAYNGEPDNNEDTSDDGAVKDGTPVGDPGENANLKGEVPDDAPHEEPADDAEAAHLCREGDPAPHAEDDDASEGEPLADVHGTLHMKQVNARRQTRGIADGRRLPSTMTAPAHRSASPRRWGECSGAATDTLVTMRA